MIYRCTLRHDGGPQPEPRPEDGGEEGWKDMREIRVILMDTPSAEADGVKIQFPYRKVEGLFYYLCVKKRITRDEAVGVFWEDCTERGARKNLRDAVYHIRRAAGAEAVELEGNTAICLSRAVNWDIDVDRIKADPLREYRGEFLRYFYIKNCLEFDSWAGEVRGGLREQFIAGAESALREALKGGRAREAAEWMERLAGGLYFDEELLRRTLSLLIEEKEYSRAEAVFKKYSELLKRDLDEEPEPETEALMERAGEMRRLKRRPEAETGEKPEVKTARMEGQPPEEQFLGRERELCEILGRIRRHCGQEGGGNRPEGAENFILITGEAGVGKTALLDYVRRELQGEMMIVSCSCCPSDEELYLKPWNELTEQMRRRLELEGDAPEPPGAMADCRMFATRYSIYIEEMARRLSGDGKTRGVVLLLDDIQWMDGASLKLLENLLFRLKSLPLAVVAAARNAGREEIVRLKLPAMRAGLFFGVELPCFTMEETREVVRAIAGETFADPESLRMIYRNTDGNALFLTELLKTLKLPGGGYTEGRKTGAFA